VRIRHFAGGHQLEQCGPEQLEELRLLTKAATDSATPGSVRGTGVHHGRWLTSSTSVADPSVTLARTHSDTFAGIAPPSVRGCVLAQVLGAIIALVTIRVLWPDLEVVGRDIVVLHESTEVQAAAASRG